MEYEGRVPDQEVDQRKLGEKKDRQARKLNREDAMDCNRRREQIRDDCPGQNPESRKTAVVVVVAVSRNTAPHTPRAPRAVR